MSSSTTGVWVLNQNPAYADVKTAEQGVRCTACGMTVTNSQPDCRCS